MAYDERCFELATYFLDESVSLCLLSELAQHIQDSIEDWIEHRGAPIPPEPGKSA